MAKRRVQPKFFLFLTILAALVGGVILVAGRLSGERHDEAAAATATPVPTAPSAATPTPAPPLPEGLSVSASGEANPSLFGFSYSIAVKREETASYT